MSRIDSGFEIWCSGNHQAGGVGPAKTLETCLKPFTTGLVVELGQIVNGIKHSSKSQLLP
jgi:hypothetical protein